MALEPTSAPDQLIPPHPSPDGENLTLPPGSPLAREAARRTRRSFIGLGLAGVAGVLGWRYLLNAPDAEGTPAPFRRVLDALCQATTVALVYVSHYAHELPDSLTHALRLNAGVGTIEAFG